jgi:opacity protein-like surface antigen
MVPVSRPSLRRSSPRALSLAGAALALLAAPAAAADLDAPIFMAPDIATVPVEIGNGWYIRGDVGYSLQTKSGDVHYRTYDPTTGDYSNTMFDTASIGTQYSGGLGVGYQFTSFLRADATLDMFQGRFDGTTSAAFPCIPGQNNLIGTHCRTVDDASFTAYSALANAYVDLGNWWGLTPYVGAGAGYTLMNWNDLNNALICVDDTAACPSPSLIGNVRHEGRVSGRFTYALMGGASYDLSQNAKLDLGYRYTRIAGGDMFGFDQASRNAGAAGVQGKDSGIDRHEVRIGLRYSLW